MDICGTTNIECCYCQPVCGFRKEVEKMDNKVSLNYEAECKMLRELLSKKEYEWKEKEEAFIQSLRKYEMDIRLLKAKMSIVELIFGNVKS